MTGLEKLKKVSRDHHCENGCTRGKGGLEMKRMASHIFWMASYPTYLCTPCSREWPAIYESAR